MFCDDCSSFVPSNKISNNWYLIILFNAAINNYSNLYIPLFFLFLIWDFILFLVILGLFSNKLGFLRSQQIQYLLGCHCLGRSWRWSGHWHLHDMPSKLGNALPLFINVRKWVGSLLTLDLLNNLTQVKVMPHRRDFTS